MEHLSGPGAKSYLKPPFGRLIFFIIVSSFFLSSCIKGDLLPDKIVDETDLEDDSSKSDTLQLMMLEANPLPGNFYIGSDDSVEVVFNKPVQLVELLNLTQHCLPDLHPVLTHGNRRLLFYMGCMGLGETGEFQVTVKDDADNVLKERFTLNFYQDRFEFKGMLKKLKYEEESQTIWMATEFPNQLYELDARSLTIRKRISLPFVPENVHLSVYNQKLYILGETPQIHIYDPATLQKIQSIDIFAEPSPFDHPDFPATIPYDIVFTRTGKGLVLFKNHLSSANKVRIIDASNEHIIYWPSQKEDFEKSSYDRLAGGLQLARDKNTIIVNELHRSNRLLIFDPETELFTDRLPLQLGFSAPIILNRQSDVMFNFQGYLQYLWFPDGSFSRVTEFPLKFFVMPLSVIKNTKQKLCICCLIIF
jgi:hypothetical protein